MAWYAYCIAEKEAFPGLAHHRKPVPLDEHVGVLGNQIFLYPASDFAVVVSEHNPADNLDQKSAVDHARVIADCFQHSTVLPFRFGTVFSDDDALRRSVRSNQRQFNANVERLRGKAEMHLKVVLEDGGPDCPKYLSSPTAGKEYLSRLRETASLQRERQTKAKAVFVQVHRMFSPLEEEISCRRTDRGKMLLDIAHLIAHDNIARYQNKYSCASQMLPECQMALSGPWPPYHFVHQNQRIQVSAHGHA
jgi:hypothetical protein